ncbi:universal stress protein [Aeromicrobium sp.]|uniref:universal stress protein n=1 Tax=Aeromicrobium sp. TaxID=1871063 RepID=UPI002FCADF3D
MTVVAGCTLKDSGNAALELAAMLARSTGEDVVVAVVVAAAWPPSTERVDADYRTYLTRRGEQVIAQAREWMPADVDATFVLHHAASIPTGLVEVAQQHDASVLVLGSSESGGLGQVALGSVAERIVHSSPVPVALAPRGYQAEPGGRIRRVTVAFNGTSQDRALVRSAADYSARTSSSLRVASFSVRPKMVFATTLAGAGEDLVVDEWSRQTSKVINEELDHLRGLPDVPSRLESVIGEGHGWREAIGQARWSMGDILVVGSSSHGPLASVFLGSRASKILRYAPVPVVALPRARR